MRRILMAAALVIAGTAPSLARDYPWCARTPATDFNPQCSFTSYRQCMATVSGIGGDCMQNPLLAYDRGGGRRSRHGGPKGNWDGGWDNRRW